MRSEPSPRRTVLAAVLMASGAGFVRVVKLTRGGSVMPPELTGMLPNLVCGMVVPLAVFLGTKTIIARDYLLFALLSLIGLCGYESAQLAMPKRTFDWYDIAASGVGTAVAVILGFALLLRPVKASGKRALAGEAACV